MCGACATIPLLTGWPTAATFPVSLALQKRKRPVLLALPGDEHCELRLERHSSGPYLANYYTSHVEEGLLAATYLPFGPSYLVAAELDTMAAAAPQRPPSARNFAFNFVCSLDTSDVRLRLHEQLSQPTTQHTYHGNGAFMKVAPPYSRSKQGCLARLLRAQLIVHREVGGV